MYDREYSTYTSLAQQYPWSDADYANADGEGQAVVDEVVGGGVAGGGDEEEEDLEREDGDLDAAHDLRGGTYPPRSSYEQAQDHDHDRQVQGMV